MQEVKQDGEDPQSQRVVMLRVARGTLARVGAG